MLISFVLRVAEGCRTRGGGFFAGEDIVRWGRGGLLLEVAHAACIAFDLLWVGCNAD